MCSLVYHKIQNSQFYYTISIYVTKYLIKGLNVFTLNFNRLILMPTAAVVLTFQLLFFPYFRTAKSLPCKNQWCTKSFEGSVLRSGKSPRLCPGSRDSNKERGHGFWIPGGPGQDKVLSKPRGRHIREVDCNKGDCCCCTKGGSRGRVMREPCKCKSGKNFFKIKFYLLF